MGIAVGFIVVGLAFIGVVGVAVIMVSYFETEIRKLKARISALESAGSEQKGVKDA